jgi:DNA-binding transcriptional LysR family regulator
MRDVNLRSVDLNLLVVLRALLEQAHVTRAAEIAGLSQPAMSRALARLRTLFDDPLLVRGDRGLVRTPKAAALRPRLEALLREIEGLVSERPFDPATLSGRVSVAATDYEALLLLPHLMRRLSGEAPSLDVTVVPFAAPVLERMLRGEVDLAFAVEGALPAVGLLVEPLYRDTFVTLMRAGHPAAEDLTLARFLRLDHVLVTIFGDGRGAIDDSLAEQGLTRRIALRIPHFYSAINIVAETDLVVTIPRSIAVRYAAPHGLAMLEPPVSRPPFTVISTWPAVLNADPTNAWLRGIVRDEVRRVEGTLPL